MTLDMTSVRPVILIAFIEPSIFVVTAKRLSIASNHGTFALPAAAAIGIPNTRHAFEKSRQPTSFTMRVEMYSLVGIRTNYMGG